MNWKPGGAQGVSRDVLEDGKHYLVATKGWDDEWEVNVVLYDQPDLFANGFFYDWEQTYYYALYADLIKSLPEE